MNGQDDGRGAKLAEVLAAGATALGRRLAEPEVLREGDWTTVLRCTDEAGPGTVIIKAYPPGPAGESCFAAEAAGLALAGRTGLAPVLLAASQHSLTVVMSDLGRAPSLADLLLGTDRERAAGGLLDWADACGRLAVALAGRQSELARLRRAHAGGSPSGGSPGAAPGRDMEQRVLSVAERAALVGVTAPTGLAAELTEVAAEFSRQACPVFSPGDICPDNSLLTPTGVQLIDFEDSGFHSVFLDAAYLRMPFSTCWCTFRLPAGLRGAAEERYRAQVARIWPDLTDDLSWERGVRRAVAAWSLNSMWWLLGRALAGDAPLESGVVAAPRARQLMRHRWQVLAEELEADGGLPTIGAMARELLAATMSWHAEDLPLYPALGLPS
ncbi:MAG TPA: hypothetical protein VMU95_02745 [Trebonia sp.]|nr:hypothetical protein [Trebonia sp.]